VMEYICKWSEAPLASRETGRDCIDIHGAENFYIYFYPVSVLSLMPGFEDGSYAGKNVATLNYQ